jgi:hypothetical protein
MIHTRGSNSENGTEALEAGEQLRGSATARANHMPVVAALATVGATGDAGFAVVAA